MNDNGANWRNHRWYFDADYIEREEVPCLSALIQKHGFIFDDTWKFIFHGKYKQYIIRFPHYGGTRDNPRVPTERRKDPFQTKIKQWQKKGGTEGSK